jgi:hypothetical protein
LLQQREREREREREKGREGGREGWMKEGRKGGREGWTKEGDNSCVFFENLAEYKTIPLQEILSVTLSLQA